MPTTIGGTRALYQAQAGFRNEITAALGVLLQRITGILILKATQVVDDQRVIPPGDRQREALGQVGDLIERFFVGDDLRQSFARDGVTPLAEYPRILNYWLVWPQAQVVRSHSAFMLKRLPDDLVQYLNTAQPSVQEQFIPNPLATYEAAHTWVDPNGYQLSDRIWRAGVSTRAKIDQLLSQAIAEGRSAVDIAKALESYLLPNRVGIRTLKPYGRKYGTGGASFDAMRLARTEITRAHSQASLVASRANPWVTGIDWALSASHPRVDICDSLATIGMSGERLRDPYPIDGNVQIPPAHPHCLCHSRAAVTATNQEVIDELRRMIGGGNPPPVTPVNWQRFLEWLIGGYLVDLVIDEFVVGV
jgi:hypothetical protein